MEQGNKLVIDLKFYMVRSKDGKWFRAKGMSGYGDSWVTDFRKARVYNKIGPARSCVTWWANEYPDFGIPDIVELTTMYGIILDEKDRVDAAKKRKQLKIEENKKWRLKQDIESAQEKLKEVTETLTKLTQQ